MQNISTNDLEKKEKILEINFKNLNGKVFEFDILSIQSLYNGVYTLKHNPHLPKRISFYAILLVTGGEGEHYIDFKTYFLKKGSLVFISKEQVHAFQKGQSYQGYLLLFTQNFLQKSFLEINMVQQFCLYNYQMYRPVLQLDELQFGEFEGLFQRISQEYYEPDDFATEEILRSRLKVLLMKSERLKKNTIRQHEHPAYIEEFRCFQNLIQEHLFKNRQVQFYADKMAISTKKLNMITQAINQQTAKAYINETLILETKRLLMNTVLNVKEIAYQVGFDEPTNFVKFFKKYVHQTPAEFKKQYQ